MIEGMTLISDVASLKLKVNPMNIVAESSQISVPKGCDTNLDGTFRVPLQCSPQSKPHTACSSRCHERNVSAMAECAVDSFFVNNTSAKYAHLLDTLRLVHGFLVPEKENIKQYGRHEALATFQCYTHRLRTGFEEVRA